ncbi:hypothetical protein [Oricola thermophila]|uniref:Uncharacterized protein n=1 Tax=Oricola thermophila TaxID=2742145 RepID=A0A6N1VCV5_9HYPH|nr:hypothetical protein [Oricola thermophila]QKV18740.1 hypothetical protein HTY61_09905 [Oricola thermophila]
MVRATNEHQRAALKAAVRHAIRRCGGGATAQDATRVNAAALSKYGSGDWPDNHVPVDVALDLDLDAGEPVILSALAREQGYDLRRVEPVAAEGDGDGEFSPLGALAGLTKDHAGLIAALVAAASDGILTETEIRAIEAEAYELQSQLSRLLTVLGVARSKGEAA